MFLSAHILSDESDEKDSVEINHIHCLQAPLILLSPTHWPWLCVRFVIGSLCCPE